MNIIKVSKPKDGVCSECGKGISNHLMTNFYDVAFKEEGISLCLCESCFLQLGEQIKHQVFENDKRKINAVMRIREYCKMNGISYANMEKTLAVPPYTISNHGPIPDSFNYNYINTKLAAAKIGLTEEELCEDFNYDGE